MKETLLKLEIGLDDEGNVSWNIDNTGDLCVHQILYALLDTTLTLAIQEDADFFENLEEVLQDNDFDEDESNEDTPPEKIHNSAVFSGNDTIN